MNTVVAAAVGLALIGSALIGGVFFAFSGFIMKALAFVKMVPRRRPVVFHWYVPRDGARQCAIERAVGSGYGHR